MSLATYITKRNGSARYYLRVTIPSDLIEVYGKREIWKSLRTASPTEAKAQAPAILAELQDEFSARRRGREILADDIGAIAWERYSRLVAKDERLRDRELTENELDQLWNLIIKEVGEEDHEAWRIYQHIRDEPERYRKTRAALHAALTSGDANKVHQAVSKSVERELAARYAKVEAGSSIHRKVANAVARADVEFLKRATERDGMDWGGVPTDPMLKREQKPKHAVAGSRIMDLYGQFERNKGATKKADTNDQNKKIVQLFAEFVGETFPVSELSRRHITEFRDQLIIFPKMARQVAEFRGMKFKEIIAKNREIGRKTLDERTVNKYLSAVNPFLRWLSSNGYISAPILTDDLYNAIDTEARKYKVFTSDQLKTLFASPLFRGCQSADEIHKPGNVEVRDWRYWLPLVALFSGARLGEIAQLLVDDVRQIDGIWCAYVTDQGDDEKSIKTKNARRVIPIHPELVKLGLLKMREAQRKAGHKRMFPEIKVDARGHWGVPSKELNKYIDRIGLKEKKLVIHSFRHLFADRLRLAGHLDRDFGFILGHGDKKAGITGHYGSLPQGTAKRRLKLIQTVKFEELDLKQLYLDA
ncbi:DUF6538 domain-containing protein [Bosea sp. RCC_152_1]|uniref:DUF6538 domain-containing protein n=1 Tax=Bosea sp. RCC_152_1 TaxID=3239228 RepID=UPI003524BDAF